MFNSLTIAFALAGLSLAKNIDIKVSDENANLSFTPASSTADAGDTLTFHFYPHAHNVVQADFASPCQPSANGFFSGTIPSSSGENGTTFIVHVQDLNPIWFYCSVYDHCTNGMVGVVNPTEAQTLAGWKYISNYAAVGQPSVAAGNGGTFGTTGSSSGGYGGDSPSEPANSLSDQASSSSSTAPLSTTANDSETSSTAVGALAMTSSGYGNSSATAQGTGTLTSTTISSLVPSFVSGAAATAGISSWMVSVAVAMLAGGI